MKKWIALALAAVLTMGLVACGSNDTQETTVATEATEATQTTAATEATETTEATEAAVVMTHEEFVAAELDAEVTVETYVQAKQGWWKDEAVVYCQSEDGAYLIYKLPCSEEEYAQLTEGTKIRVTGFKAEFSGELEISDVSAWEIVEGETFVAEALDVTELMSNEEELVKHQNEKIAVNGLSVKAIEYKNGEPGDDIYLTLTDGENEYSFCVEVYLTGTDSEVYQTVGELKEGDIVNVEAFLYWYEGANPHVTAISVQ